MAGKDQEALLLQLSTDVRGLQRSWERGMGIVDRSSRGMERRAQQMTAAVNRNFDQMGAGVGRSAERIRGAIAAIGIGLSVREVQQYADAWTSARNKLAAAGVETSKLGQRQNELADLAKKTRSGFTETVDLYAKLTRATGELGATSDEVARATEVVNKAFKAGGASASEQASGILQLSQALGSGVLQGDELRSLRENAPLVAKAIADEFDTTIAGLKKLGAEGELTSSRVFKALLNAGADLDAQFATTIPTIEDSFKRLQTEFGRYISSADTATASSAQLAGFISQVADNFDDFADAAVLAGSVLGGALAGQAIVKVIAGLGGLSAGATGAAGAMALLRGATAFLGGPWGAAITLIAGALGYMALQAAKAKTEMAAVRANADTASAALAEAAKYGDAAGKAVGGIGSQAATATPKVTSFAGAVGELADQMYRLAAARKAEAVNRLLGENAKAQADVVTLELQRSRQRNQSSALAAAGFGGEANLPKSVREDLNRAQAKDPTTIAQDAAIAQRKAQAAKLEAEALRLMGLGEEAFSRPEDKTQPSAAPDVKKGPKAPRDRTDERAAQIAAAMADAERGVLQSLARLTVNIDERAGFEKKILDEQTKAETARLDKMAADIEDDGGLTKAKKDELKAQIAIAKGRVEEAANLEKQLIDREVEEQAAHDRLALLQDDLQGQQGLLDIQSSLARTAKDRREIELRLVDLAEQRERADLAAIIASKESTKAEIERARRRLNGLAAETEGRREVARRDNAGPLGRYLQDTPRGIDEINEAMERMAVEGLESLNSGIANAIVNAKSLGDVARNVFRQMAADLIASVVRRNITGPLAAMLGGGKIPGFASGTRAAPGGMAWVGERGRELVNLPKGAQVVPNHMLRAEAPVGRATVVHQYVTMDNRGAVIWEQAAAGLMAYADQRAMQAGAGAVHAARGVVGSDLSRRQRRGL